MSQPESISFCSIQTRNGVLGRLAFIKSFCDLERAHAQNPNPIYVNVWIAAHGNGANVTYEWDDGTPVTYYRWFNGVFPVNDSARNCLLGLSTNLL